MTYANKIILFTSVILVGLATGKSSFFSDCGQFICANSAQAQDVETLTSQIETLDQRSDYLLKTKSEAWESLSRIRDEREETRKLLEKLKTVPLASGETEISRGIRISLTEDKVSQQTERLDDVSNEILKKEDELSEIGGRRAGLQAELEEAKLKAKNKNKAVDVETKKPAVDTEPKEKVNFSSMSLSELRAAVQELIDDRYDILGLAGIKEKLDGYISKSGAEFYGQPNGYGSNWHADLAYLWGVPEAGAEKYMKRHLGYLDQAIVNAGGDANNLLANIDYYRSGVANLHREIDFVAAVYETCVFPKLVEASQRYEEFKREFKAAMTNALDQEKHAMHSARSKEARKLGNKLSKEAMNCARNDVPDILDVDVFKTL